MDGVLLSFTSFRVDLSLHGTAYPGTLLSNQNRFFRILCEKINWVADTRHVCVIDQV
jgi:hypothetical protein